MPLSVAISTTRRAWWWTRRTTFSRVLPESWSDVPAARRLRWLSWWLESPADAPERIARDALRLPDWAWRAMGSESKAAIFDKFGWTEPTAQCERVALPEMRHDGRLYCFPTAKGENTTCIEYACADDYYKRIEAGDTEAILLLAATLWRERDYDKAATLRRGDVRTPLFDKAEVEARAKRLQGASPLMPTLALLYFMGLKMYVHRVYKGWIFEESDADEDEDEEREEGQQSGGGGPDFGWWGVFQWVAEVGVFGTEPEVRQKPFHELCVFLVRKRMESDRVQSVSTQRSGEAED